MTELSGVFVLINAIKYLIFIVFINDLRQMKTYCNAQNYYLYTIVLSYFVLQLLLNPCDTFQLSEVPLPFT